MRKYSWDGSRPNLAKLPKQLKDTLNQKIPLDIDEVYATVVLFQPRGLNHPNGRIRPAVWNKKEGSKAKGVLIDAKSHTGRQVLASLGIEKEKIPKFIYHLLKSYIKVGGTVDEINQIVKDISNEHREL